MLHLLLAVFLTSAWSSPSRNTCEHSSRRIGSTMRDQLAEACAANPNHTRLGAHADHLGRLPRGCICCVHTVELVHTSRVGVYRSTGHSHQDKQKICELCLVKTFFPQKKQKVILVQKVPCFGRSEHVGFVLRNKPAMILYLGEYLKAQSRKNPADKLN